jgi:hypothetical protein
MDIRSLRDDTDWVQKTIDDMQAMDADLKQMADDCGDPAKVEADWQKYNADYNKYCNDFRNATSSNQLPDKSDANFWTQTFIDCCSIYNGAEDLHEMCLDGTDKQTVEDAFDALDRVVVDLDTLLEPYVKPHATSPTPATMLDATALNNFARLEQRS